MRNLFAMFLATFFSTTIFAEIRTAPPIQGVTVYRSGAKITRGERILLPAGKSEIVFENLSPYFNASSLQVKIEGNAQLNGAVFQMHTPGIEPENPRIPVLRDSLVLFGDMLVRLQNEQQVLQKEAALIENNLVKIGEKTKDGLLLSLADVKEMTAFYRKEMLRIKERFLQIDIETRAINKDKQSINLALGKLQPNRGNSTGEIVLHIESKFKQTLMISCSYLISQTGWTPLYDIKSKDSDSPLHLLYKANVLNKSGFDWKNVKLTLSSAQPFANNERPQLAPVFVDFRVYAQVTNNRNDTQLEEVAVTSYQLKNMATEVVSTSGSPVQNLPSVFEVEKPTEYATVFEIDGLQDILANGEENIVTVKEEEIPADYEFHAVPKLDPTVYLLAKMVNYGSYDLLPGKANIFFHDTYIGQTYLNPNTSSDTMLLSLGRDEQIYVKRCQPKDYTYKMKFFNSKVKEEFAYEITIKNNKTSEISINVLDQIPVSRQEDIEVELLENSGATFNKVFGKLEWNVTIKPGRSAVLRFAYALKYPKGKSVQIAR